MRCYLRIYRSKLHIFTPFCRKNAQNLRKLAPSLYRCATMFHVKHLFFVCRKAKLSNLLAPVREGAKDKAFHSYSCCNVNVSCETFASYARPQAQMFHVKHSPFSVLRARKIVGQDTLGSCPKILPAKRN